MPIANTELRGKRLSNRPSHIVRCGLSRAHFAEDCRTNQWYELSTEGAIIGVPTEFDFYRPSEGERPRVSSVAKEPELSVPLRSCKRTTSLLA